MRSSASPLSALRHVLEKTSSSAIAFYCVRILVWVGCIEHKRFQRECHRPFILGGNRFFRGRVGPPRCLDKPLAVLAGSSEALQSGAVSPPRLPSVVRYQLASKPRSFGSNSHLAVVGNQRSIERSQAHMEVNTRYGSRTICIHLTFGRSHSANSGNRSQTSHKSGDVQCSLSNGLSARLRMSIARLSPQQASSPPGTSKAR